MSEEELRRKARVRAEAKFYFYVHLIVYCVVNLAFFLLWLFRGGWHVFGIPWFLFVLVFWAIGVVAHYLTVVSPRGYLQRMTEEEYRKLKQEQGQQ